jgi:hypothetical protein
MEKTEPDKIKVCVWLEPELYEYLDTARGEELRIPQFIRVILKQKMKSAAKRKPKSVASDPFSYYIINPEVIPDDLKEYADLLIEWWPIRKKKGASCTQSVANRIFNTLRSFPSQDRKQALENAITGGWKNIYELKKGYKPEEPQFKPKYFKASDQEIVPTLAELGKTAKDFMEEK